jgi:dihydroorotate dehydrogenase
MPATSLSIFLRPIPAIYAACKVLILNRLLNHLKNRRAQLATQQSRYVPIAIKIAPDLDEEQIAAIADIALNTQIDGFIATNTTIDLTVLGNHKFAQEAGGLSGLPVQTQSNHVLR